MQFIAEYPTEPPQELLTLGGCPIVGGGCDIISGIFARERSR